MNSYMEFASPCAGNATTVCTELVLDVSPSMLDEDYRPSRIKAAITASQKLIDEKAKSHPEDLVGIVCFGGWARSIHRPRPVRQYRDSLCDASARLSIISATNVTAGLVRAMRDLDRVRRGGGTSGSLHLLRWVLGRVPQASVPVKSCVGHVICLSDGGWNDGDDPIPIATQLKGAGVLIDSIGIGGSPSSVNEDLMRGIASVDREGHPRYRFIGDTTALIQEFQKLAGHIRVLEQ